MFEFDETFSDLSSSSSAATFDFTELLDPHEFQLMSRSLSLEALPTIADEFFPPFDDVPPFPPNKHLLPMASMLPSDYTLKSPRYDTVPLDSVGKTRETLMSPTTQEPRVIDTNVVYFISPFISADI
jgi:hypothetical protein